MSKFENLNTGIVVSVADSKDDRFTDGWKVFGSSAARPEGAPSASWKVADLKAHAEENGIDLGEATKKEEIVAAITAAATPAE
jgi:hypothetical protein